MKLPDASQGDFERVSDAYQRLILSGQFLPGRNLTRDIAEWEYRPREFPLYNPEKDVENIEVDGVYHQPPEK